MLATKAYTQYSVRKVEPSDVELMAEQRLILYKGLINPKDNAIFSHSSAIVCKELLNTNQLFAWLVECDGCTAAMAGIVTRPLLPNSTNPTGCTEAFVVHVYTEPNYRRRGFAKSLLETIIDWCRNHNIERITLQASDEGIPFYKSLGFKLTKEMRLDIKDFQQA